MYHTMLDGTQVEVPLEVEEAGPDAMERWHVEEHERRGLTPLLVENKRRAALYATTVAERLAAGDTRDKAYAAAREVLAALGPLVNISTPAAPVPASDGTGD